MEGWKTLTRSTVLDRGRFLVVENHVVELPDGQVIPDWSWIVTPDFANVVAVTEDGLFLCFRQTKYAVEGPVLAPVGGYLEPGEEPLAGAKRELLEETGYAAERWIAMGDYRVDGNRGAGTAHLFLALGARRVADPNADDLEEQELLHLSREEIETALFSGGIKVLPWAACFALGLEFLRKHGA